MTTPSQREPQDVGTQGSQRSIWLSADEWRALDVLADRVALKRSQVMRQTLVQRLRDEGLDPARRAEWDTAAAGHPAA